MARLIYPRLEQLGHILEPPAELVVLGVLCEPSSELTALDISPGLWERERTVLREAGVLIVAGHLEKRGRAWTLRAETLVDAGPE